MKKLILFVTLALPTAASAQQQPNPTQEQVERTIGNLVVANISCNAQTATLNAEVARLTKELAEAKK